MQPEAPAAHRACRHRDHDRGRSRAGEAALVFWYCALATVLVWGPVIVYVLLGNRAVGIMTRAQQRLAQRQPGVKVYALLVVAGMPILDAISLLL